MFKRSFVGLIVASALAGACNGEIGGLYAEASPEQDSDLVATLSVSDGWRSIEAAEPAFDTLEFGVMARPRAPRMDAGIAVGGQDIASDAPIKVRFAKEGFVEVQNGHVWDSQETLRYRPDVWYHIMISADMGTRTYDVEVEQHEGPPGEPPVTLISGAAFDPEASVSDQLTTWAVWSSQGAILDLAEASWVASGSCVPATCLSLGVECGEPSDGCRGTLSCGGCASGQACTAGVCVDMCVPRTCQSLGDECGEPSDGCGGTLSCGGCASGQTCASGLCVSTLSPLPPPCVPETCQSLGAECGTVSDGCGGSLSCGGCASGQTCASGLCVCAPESCWSLGIECSTVSDGCGGTLSCGSCANSQTCDNGVCVSVSPPSACTPDCSGKQCGDDGCGGSCGTCSGAETCNNISGQCVEPVGLIWTDSIQSGVGLYGFDGMGTNHPLSTSVPPGDANGANLSRVPDPLGGSGYALRQYAFLEDGGARSQLGLYSFLHEEFRDLALSGEPIYVAQEWYFPETIEAGGDSAPWLNLFDWHTTAEKGQARWHTCPGMMLNEDGSMRFRFGWGAGANALNASSNWSSIGLPVGEWFDVEMRWQFATGPSATVSVWINGELALEQVGVVTALPEHSAVELYVKLYGSDQGRTPWSPSGTEKYVRNFRISGQRNWR